MKEFTGIVYIHIDGLEYGALQSALAQGLMPALRSYIDQQKHSCDKAQ